MIIKQEAFEGPLDLLLSLIEQDELDITTVSLAKVTDQYLAYVEDLERQQLSEVSDWLVVAARLLLLKSRALLPGEAVEEEGEDDLAARLREYQKIKHLARRLETQLATRAYSVGKPAVKLEVPPQLLTDGVEVAKLETAFSQLIRNMPVPRQLSTERLGPKITIEESIAQVRDRLRGGPTTFDKLFTGLQSRLAMIVTFLAILELFKQRLLALADRPELTVHWRAEAAA